MIYYDLADSLTELDILSNMITKLETGDIPVMQLMNDDFLINEIRRIKARASSDILIFGNHSDIYVNKNMREINRLILQLLDILKELPQLVLMDNSARYVYTYAIVLKSELAALYVFFADLKEGHEDPDQRY